MNNELLITLDEVSPAPGYVVGNDLVFLPDFTGSFNELFKNKVYSGREQAYCDQFDNAILHYASTWAAKEAVYKGIKQLDTATLGWKNIEIIREQAGGKPTAMIHQHRGVFTISLTLSHDGDYAWAVALIKAVN